MDGEKSAPPSYAAVMGGRTPQPGAGAPPPEGDGVIHFDSHGRPYEIRGGHPFYLDSDDAPSAGAPLPAPVQAQPALFANQTAPQPVSLAYVRVPGSATATPHRAPPSAASTMPPGSAGYQNVGSFATTPAARSASGTGSQSQQQQRMQSPASYSAAARQNAPSAAGGYAGSADGAPGDARWGEPPAPGEPRWGEINVEPQHSSRAALAGLALSMMTVQNPAFFMVMSVIYNLPQVIAICVALIAFWDDGKMCRYDIPTWLIVNCILRAWFVLFSFSKYRRIISEGMAPIMFEATGLARFHRLIHFFNSIWFIIGCAWIFREAGCNSTTNNPVFATALACLILMWVNLLLPCIILLVLIPLVCCCAPCIMRCLVLFMSDDIRARDPSRAKIDQLPITQYRRPSQPPQGAAAPATESCSICIVDFQDGEDIKVLPCAGRHKYHVECIDNWLKINPVCCLCRTPVFDGQGDPIAPQAPTVRS